MLKLLLLSLVLGVALAEDDVILEPLSYKVGLPQASLIMFQGAYVPAAEYTSFVREIQSRLPLELWAAIPAFPDDLAVFSWGYYSTVVPRVFATLHSLGLAVGAPAFYAGHSLGGINGLYYVTTLNTSEVAAFAQLSSAPGWDFNHSTFPHPHLVATGELDRLVSVNTLAATYNNVALAGPSTVLRCPVVYIPGGNHMSGWTSGPTASVKAYDIRTEITDNNALSSLADITSDFFIAALPSSLIASDIIARSRGHVSERVSVTGQFLAPIIAALEMEGSSRLNSTAPQSCPTARLAVSVMAGLNNNHFKLSVSDVEVFNDSVFAGMSASITASCASAQKANRVCTVEAATASEPAYSSVYYAYAAEIRMMMPSRQAFARASYNTSADASADSGSICSQINAAVIQWALATAAPATLSRYNRVGEKIVVGADVVMTNSTVWLATAITVQSATINNSTVLQVLSPSFFGPIGSADHPGSHFCKVLSPAYVMNWIYTDSLYLNYNLASA